MAEAGGRLRISVRSACRARSTSTWRSSAAARTATTTCAPSCRPSASAMSWSLPRGRMAAIELACSDPALPPGRTTWWCGPRACSSSVAACRQGADVALRKAIPVGGGLGGGSADAALTLLGLARLWRLDAGREELTELAAAVGSDVAFFLSGGTALCEGRGERVTPVSRAARSSTTCWWRRRTASRRARSTPRCAGGLTSQADAK